MTRIAIIGNVGGGKSTLAGDLHELLEIPLHSIDQLQWRPGWQLTPKEEFAAAHAQLFAQPSWIIDGWGEFDFIEERFRESDTIILVDYPLVRHYWWTLKRQWLCLFRPRINGPPRCPMLPMTLPLLKMIWAINRQAMPKLRQLVKSQDDGKRIFHIRTLAELRAFYREARRHAENA